MKILDTKGNVIQTLADWETHCPPASKIHWKEGRSAMETAKNWLFYPPKEFLQLFGSGFKVEEVYPEHKTAFDNYSGNTRNHDLLVIGKTVQGDKIVACVESKVDEPFGNPISKQIVKAGEALQNNPRSKALQRIKDLRIALFGVENDNQLDIKYQLMTAVAGALTEAKIQNVEQVYFVIQTFVSDRINSKKHRKNQIDLDYFIETMSNGKHNVINNGDMLGPFTVPGNNFISKEIKLYFGKIEIKI